MAAGQRMVYPAETVFSAPVPYRREDGELKLPEDTLNMYRASHLLVELFSPGRPSIEIYR